MSPAGFRLASRQGDVDRADLVDREGLADSVDAADARQQRQQLRFGNAEDFEVEILRGFAEQPIADEAADRQGAAAAIAHTRGDLDGEWQRVRAHATILCSLAVFTDTDAHHPRCGRSLCA